MNWLEACRPIGPAGKERSMEANVKVEEVLIGSIPKKDGEEIRVRRSTFNGRPYVDVRVFYRTEAGEWSPTKKGVAFAPERVGELVDLLKTAAG